MTPSVTPRETPLTRHRLDQALDAARRYATASRADSTWRAYRSDWRRFDAWCVSVARPALPADPETVALFLAAEADRGRAPSTLERRLAAIRLVHLGAGHPSPHNALKVAEVLRGIRRRWAKPKQKKAPALNTDILRMVDAISAGTRRGLRDRALLLFGFAGAFRRSELVALNTWNLTERDEGMLVTIERSKTDQESEGHTIAIVREPGSPYCPVAALTDWLAAAKIEDRALFRRTFKGDVVSSARLSPQTVALVVKNAARRAGLDATRYAGHSLRSGFLTSAAKNRANVFKMVDQSRHRSLQTVREYVVDEDRFTHHAGTGLLQSILDEDGDIEGQ